MAGIYIHIPYCRQACYYCDFHFSTNQSTASDMLSALGTEIKQRREYFQGEKVETIYFGGGTPSIFTPSQLEELIQIISNNYKTVQKPEITLEANPDDLSRQKLAGLKEVGFNRLSIGIQSFNDEVLKGINRVHNSRQALVSVDMARKMGFENISIDLIYAIPNEPADRWKSDVEIALTLFPEHISTYCLTIEPGTVFGQRYKKGELKPMDDGQAAEAYEFLIERLTDAGYDHYEISNFARPGYISQHNSGYWKGKKYLGIGPGAHSYNALFRQYNISNNTKYIKALKENRIPATIDQLQPNDRINEYMLVRLRTKWGVNSTYLKKEFGYDLFKRQEKYLSQLQENGMIRRTKKHIYLTRRGKLLADQIAEDLFII